MLASLRQLAERSIDRRAVRRRSTALRRELADAPGRRRRRARARWTARTRSATWLDDRGVDHAWQIGTVLAAAGADPAWLDEVEAAVGAAARRAGAALDLDHDRRPARLLGELTDTTERISHLVDDVKSYSQIEPGARCRPSTSTRASRARWRCWRRSSATSRSSATFGADVRRSRPTPPSSTRCGRT